MNSRLPESISGGFHLLGPKIRPGLSRYVPGLRLESDQYFLFVVLLAKAGDVDVDAFELHRRLQD